jgi:fibronectin type III domain protein
MKLPFLPDNLTPSARQRILLLLLVWLLILPACLCQASRQVTLAWKANTEATLMGYQVFCRQRSDIYHYNQPVWDGTAVSCTLPGLDEYTDYAFVVRAYDVYGNQSPDSNEVWLAGQAASPRPPTVISPENNAPDLFLTPVLQAAAFRSPDTNDQHLLTRWVVTRVSDGRCVLDVTSSDCLTELDIPPLVLEEDTWYSWEVRYYGTRGTLSDWSSPRQFCTGESGLDQGGNGIPDDQEVGISIDLDNNTIADAEQDDLRCVNVLEGASQMAVCAPDGSGVARISAMESTDPATLGSDNRIPFDLPLGLISFRLEMDHVGGIARIRVYFSEPAPQAARWIKYDSINGWQDYSAHAAFALDRLSVEIEIQDGGAGDADGVKNGIVIDPSGYGIATTSAASDMSDSYSLDGYSASMSSGSGGGCFVSILKN